MSHNVSSAIMSLNSRLAHVGRGADLVPPRQLCVLLAIQEHLQTHGYPPTMRDLMKRMDVRSPNGIMCFLRPLEAKGLISRGGFRARAIRLNYRYEPLPQT